MICVQCSNDFDQVTTRQLFCTTVCRNAYNAKKRTEIVRQSKRGVIELIMYQIKCKANNMVYIGFSSDIEGRWSKHLNDLNTRTHSDHRFQIDYDKYGVEQFELSVIYKHEITDDFGIDEIREIQRRFLKIRFEQYNSENSDKSITEMVKPKRHEKHEQLKKVINHIKKTGEINDSSSTSSASTINE